VLEFSTKDLYITEALVSDCQDKAVLANTLRTVRPEFISIQLLHPDNADFVFENLTFKEGAELVVKMSSKTSAVILPRPAEVRRFWEKLVDKLAASPPCSKVTVELECEEVILDLSKLPHL